MIHRATVGETSPQIPRQRSERYRLLTGVNHTWREED
jgi:hypothetical protein